MHNTVEGAAASALALMALQPGGELPEITTALAGAGWRVVRAFTAKTALAAAAAEPPRLLIVDADIPPLGDGRHLAVALRHLRAGTTPPRLVLLASSRSERVESLAAAAAAARVLVLPAAATRESAEVVATTPTAEPATRTVWVVDDNHTIRLLARCAFERSGWQVREFEDLRAARAALGSLTTPEAVLLDIHLPDGNGLEHVRSFAASGAAVVVVSNLAGAEQVELAFASGAQDVVPKPFDLRSLVARVERAALASSHLRGANELELALIRNTEWV